MAGAHMGYFFYMASSAVLSPPPSSDLTHWLGPWRRLTVQTKPHLIFLCHDFYSFIFALACVQTSPLPQEKSRFFLFGICKFEPVVLGQRLFQ